jgi:hypothetical protein
MSIQQVVDYIAHAELVRLQLEAHTYPEDEPTVLPLRVRCQIDADLITSYVDPEEPPAHWKAEAIGWIRPANIMPMFTTREDFKTLKNDARIAQVHMHMAQYRHKYDEMFERHGDEDWNWISSQVFTAIRKDKTLPNEEQLRDEVRQRKEKRRSARRSTVAHKKPSPSHNPSSTNPNKPDDESKTLRRKPPMNYKESTADDDDLFFNDSSNPSSPVSDTMPPNLSTQSTQSTQLTPQAPYPVTIEPTINCSGVYKVNGQNVYYKKGQIVSQTAYYSWRAREKKESTNKNKDEIIADLKRKLAVANQSTDEAKDKRISELMDQVGELTTSLAAAELNLEQAEAKIKELNASQVIQVREGNLQGEVDRLTSLNADLQQENSRYLTVNKQLSTDLKTVCKEKDEYLTRTTNLTTNNQRLETEKK